MACVLRKGVPRDKRLGYKSRKGLSTQHECLRSRVLKT